MKNGRLKPIFNFSFFIVNGKWKMGVHFPFFTFHLRWKIKMTVRTRTRKMDTEGWRELLTLFLMLNVYGGDD